MTFPQIGAFSPVVWVWAILLLVIIGLMFKFGTRQTGAWATLIVGFILTITVVAAWLGVPLMIVGAFVVWYDTRSRRTEKPQSPTPPNS